MTREEKIAELINIRDNFNYSLAPREVFDDAIEALEQEGYYKDLAQSYEKTIVKLTEAIAERQPNEDCVSRKAVHDLIATWLSDYLTDETREALETIDGKVEDLPPVTPTRKKGEWIVEVWNNKEHHTCSSCQHIIDYEPCYHYCPMCGAEMESEDKE